jgi:hypothetical protein
MHDIAPIGSPTFAYIHLVMPHPPFIFTEEGEYIPQDIPLYWGVKDAEWKLFEGRSAEDYVRYYTNQLIYADKRILESVENILAYSPEPPIVILQSDHGPASLLDWANPTDAAVQERMSILNAYYFPKQDYSILYKTITPVNTFRIVFNEYFGTNYEFLEDKNYFSTWLAPYQFRDVTEIVELTSLSSN